MIEGILSNHWWAMIASDYSVTMLLVVTGVGVILKIIAVINPSVKTSAVTDLISGWVYGLPGMKERIVSVGPTAYKGDNIAP